LNDSDRNPLQKVVRYVAQIASEQRGLRYACCKTWERRKRKKGSFFVRSNGESDGWPLERRGLFSSTKRLASRCAREIRRR